jgi:hypothetical protein
MGFNEGYVSRVEMEIPRTVKVSILSLSHTHTQRHQERRT